MGAFRDALVGPAWRDCGERRSDRGCGLAGLLVVGWLAAVAAVLVSYATVPLHRDAQEPVDALLVLGSPATSKGLPGDEQRWRVDEAVSEYRRGRARHIVMSGGAVANGFAEAEVMARYARSQGVPGWAIVTERRSRNTVENVLESERILRMHGWRRVEVISSEAHLHRAALLLERTDLDWGTHAAPMPGIDWRSGVSEYAEEAIGTALVRWLGLRAVPVLHEAAVIRCMGSGLVLYGLKSVLKGA